MKNITLLAIVAIALASCSKSKTPEPSNIVTVTGAVGKDLVTTGSGSSYYWSTRATFNKAIPDSSFVVIQWDMINGTGSPAGTMRDTVRIGINHCCTQSHRTSTSAPGNWTTTNVKIVNAWSKNGHYAFEF